MKKVIIICLLVCAGTAVHAQFQLSRLTIGGGLGMQFGDYTVVNFSPQVGYNFTNYFNAGAGINYTYYSRKYDDSDWRKQTNSYFGFNVYGKLYPLPFLVLMVQPELNRMWRTVELRGAGGKLKENEIVPSCLVGAGLRMGPVTAMIQYDVAQDDNSPYSNKIFYSVGYTFSF